MSKTLLRQVNNKKVVVATLMGNVMEFYDFIVFAFMSVYISNLFFSNAPENIKLLYTFGIFASGYLTRPLGSLIFGYIGDKHGRKISIYYSILLATISTVTIGILPTYNDVGALSAVLLIICRLLQGFAVSGEEGGAAVYLYEVLGKGKAGLGGSLVLSSAYLGVLLGSLVCLIINHLFTRQEIYNFAWRIPFILSVILGMITIILRRNIQESSEYSSLEKRLDNPVSELLKSFKAKIIIHIFMVAGISISVYMFTIFIPTYLISHVQLAPQTSQIISACSLLALALGAPIFGSLSDRVGYERMFTFGCAANIILGYPAFILISTGTIWKIIAGISILGFPLFAIAGSVFALLLQEYPAALRFSGVSLIFNTSMSTFGSVTPLFCIHLINKLQVIHIPGIVVAFSGLIGIASYIFYSAFNKKLNLYKEKYNDTSKIQSFASANF